MSNVHFLREPAPVNAEHDERRRELFARAEALSTDLARRGAELDRVARRRARRSRRSARLVC